MTMIRPDPVQALLHPIAPGAPAGEDLLFSHDFDVIQEARRFEDASLDQGEWVTEVKEADWDLVIGRSITLMSTHTKDLRLAVWLTEAWGIKEGLPGLMRGYALLDGLCTDFWDSFHPLPEEGDQAYRLGNVAWLSGRTAALLREIPLTQGDGYGALDWDVANHLVQAVIRDPDNADDILRDRITMERFDTARRATPPSFYTRVLRELALFDRAVKTLEATLDTRAGDDAPSFRDIKDTVDTVRRLAERFAKEAGIHCFGAPEGTASCPSPQGMPGSKAVNPRHAHERIAPPFDRSEVDSMGQRSVIPVAGDGGGDGLTSGAASGCVGGPIASRTQAIACLLEVAVYFRRTEPHSPAAYMAEKAATWADMPLHEWLNAVVKDGASLAHLNDLLGLKRGEG